MGQMTYAIMLGVAVSDVPESVDLYGEDGDSGLLGRWQAECADKIKAYEQRHPRKSGHDPYGEDVYVPQQPYEGLDILGFYLAVGASGKAGVPSLGGCALSDVKATYPDAYRAARRGWRRFAKWAASQGVSFPKAKLFLTETEVA